MRKFSTLILAMLFSTSTFAVNTKTIFSCTTTNGKPLVVKQVGSDYQFAYDKVKVSNAIQRVVTNHNSSVMSRSGYILFSLDFTKDSRTSYFIQYQELMGDGKPLFAGAFLAKDGVNPKQIAKCNLSKKIEANFDTNIMQQFGTGY